MFGPAGLSSPGKEARRGDEGVLGGNVTAIGMICIVLQHDEHVWQHGRLTAYMRLSLSHICSPAGASLLARVLVFMSLFVFIFACLAATHGPRVECSRLRPVLNLQPTFSHQYKVGRPPRVTFSDPPGLTSSL